jgi:uncharacterized protein DUF4157/HNH/endonuclease VII toxin of polymorphic toxin system component
VQRAVAGVSVSSPGDADEREARHLSRKAFDGMPASPVSPQATVPGVARSAEDDRRSARGHPMAGLGTEEQLSSATRQLLRPRLGVDLSDVRLHTGPAADRNAKNLGAQAFTYGHDVVFAAGRYDPGSRAGLELLTHELVHVGQQAPGRAALSVQRDATDLPPKPANFPIPVVGTPPKVSVNLSSVVFTFTDATNHYVAGPKSLQMNFIAVRALVADQISDDWAARAAQFGADNFGMTGTGELTETATGGEVITSYAAFTQPLKFLTWLATQGKTLIIAGDRLRILQLGEAANWLIDTMQADADFSAAVLQGKAVPDWLNRALVIDEMHRHGTELRAFGDAKDASDAKPGDQAAHSAMTHAAAALFTELLKPVAIMERIRADPALTAEVGYRLIWPPEQQPKSAAMTRPPVAAADRTPDAMFGAGFLGFLWTQQNLWPDLMLSSAKGTAARTQVLKTYSGWAGQVKAGEPGDIELLDKPPTANMPALPAMLTSTPDIGPPLFDASVESDYHFTMALEFPSLLEAFSSYSYYWGRKKVSDEEIHGLGKFDPFKGAKRPTWGEVGAKRFSKANEYARADIKRTIDNFSSLLGSPGVDVSLIEAGIVLRYIATGITWVIERLFTPRSERAISFAGDDLGPGLYVVACSASPRSQGENFVRAPAVAWMPVFVRRPEEMAEIRLDAIVKSQEGADARLAELQKKLAEPVSWLDHDAMVAEADAILKSKQGMDETINLQIKQLTDRYAQIKDSDDPERIKEREAIDRQLDSLRDTLETRGNRASKLTGPIERVPAVFVTDKGQVLTLALEATRQSVDNDESGNEISETWYVSDLTTPRSGDETGTGKDKAEAIHKALVKLLSAKDRYGRGTLSVAVGKRQWTQHIDADGTALLLEALENVATVASIAAVVAAPFTGGASLALLLPIGLIGAIPSGYRIARNLGEGTFRWDMSLLSDVVNIVGGIAGLGEVASGMGMLRLARGLMITGIGANGLGVLVMGEQIAEQLDSLSDLPPGLRAARTFEILGNAFIQAGVMIGASMVEKGKSAEFRESLGHAEGPQAIANKGKAAEAWLDRLSPETQDALRADPVAMETFRAMDPEVRRALTLCGSLCIPIPPPPPEQLAKIRDFMKRAGVPDTHQDLREYLHDMRSRGELKQASEALSHCDKLSDAQRLFDAAIVRWAKDRGGSARKVGLRWEFTRADGSVILEWEVDTFKNLADTRATNSYFQAHHGIQHAWAEGRGIPGYTRDGCPAILLRDSFAGSPHRRITDRQIGMADSAPTRTYAEERALMISDLQSAEVSSAQADRLVNESDKYFGDLYRKWAADLKAEGKPDTALKAAFGDWRPK